jgi:hypothetical protein
VEKQLGTVVNKGKRYIYFSVSLKYLPFFLFYLAGGKTFQPTFVKQVDTTLKTTQ